ncbi:sugar nucleotide-binding protein [Altererythrobacter salegens]|uniref:dTDP-4-dehydrorhamnose reductase n=2 Tax=Croceibacterium salegens TaxID=1737568 RepID=A0A6I4SWY6_9SPHN|nr:sugar nucleotide-binding protein [Croceibacterium salegens]
MIGFGLWSYFRASGVHEAVASARSTRDAAAFRRFGDGLLYISGHLATDGEIDALFAATSPDVVVNCAGVTFHTEQGMDPLVAIPANAVLPHRLHAAARRIGARLIHITTDCVYKGDRGHYSEGDEPDAPGLYGRSKVLGEIADADDALTIRTSTVGFELSSARGLLGWFLAQQGKLKGFTRAYFSGLATPELGRAIERYVLTDQSLCGLYHVAGPKISKFELLTLFKEAFGSTVEIVSDDELAIDRSLDGSKFSSKTGYAAPSWEDMVAQIVDFAPSYPESAATSCQRG